MKKKKLKKLLKRESTFLLEEKQKNRDLEDIQKANLKIIEEYIKVIADLEDDHLTELNKITKKSLDKNTIHENELANQHNNYMTIINTLRNNEKFLEGVRDKLIEDNKELEELVIIYSNESYKSSKKDDEQ